MPSTAQFHLPVPALPSHYPPHPIYAVCSGLYSIMAQIAPSDVALGTTAERWGLMQKVPHAPSSSITDHGDWFTAGVDPREVGGLLEKLKKIQGDKLSDGSLLEQLASTGDRFGTLSPPYGRSRLNNSLRQCCLDAVGPDRGETRCSNVS
jgi:hypothetical protein